MLNSKEFGKLNIYKTKMKKLLAFVCVVLALVLAINLVSAADLAQNGQISVTANDRILGTSGNADSPIAVFAGETIPIKVGFIAAENAQDVRVKVAINGYANDIELKGDKFDIINGSFYVQTLNLQIPYDLQNQLSDNFPVTVTVYNAQDSSSRDFSIVIQRESYNLGILSVDTQGTAVAGQDYAVDVVLKNMGMRDLQDLFLTVSIPALNIERTGYFNDIFAVNNYSQENIQQDSISGRIFLTIPDTAASGDYKMNVEARDSDVDVSATQQITVQNNVGKESVVAPITGKSVTVNQEADYTVLIVNPTNAVKIYTLVPETSSVLNVAIDEPVVAVPAGSSKEVTVKVTALQAGTSTFGVNVYSGNSLVQDVQLTANAVAGSATSTITGSPVIALTIVLAIIFVVLLVVLIALLARKPQKTEEFGESYY